MRGARTPRIWSLAEPRDATGRNDESHAKAPIWESAGPRWCNSARPALVTEPRNEGESRRRLGLPRVAFGVLGHPGSDSLHRPACGCFVRRPGRAIRRKQLHAVGDRVEDVASNRHEMRST
jgi:hypothetical protein